MHVAHIAMVGVFLFIGFHAVGAQAAVPKQILDWQAEAAGLEQSGDLSGAQAVYEQIIRSYPSTGYAMDGQFQIIRLYLKAGQPARAKIALETLRQTYAAQPEYVRCLHETARQFILGKDYATAIQICERLQQQFGNHESAPFFQQSIVEAYAAMGDVAGAKRAAEVLLSAYAGHPAVPVAVRKAANAFRINKYDVEAVQLYRSVINKWPDSPDAIYTWRGLACSLIRLGDEAAAKTAMDTILSDFATHPEAAKVYRKAADVYRQTNRHEEAIQFYRTVMNRWPETPDEMYVQRGLACSLIFLGDLDGAKTALAALLSVHVRHPKVAMALREAADAYRLNDYDAEAVELYRTCLSRWPNMVNSMYVHRGVGCLLARQGDTAGAKAAAAEIMANYAAHPETSDAIFVIGEKFYLRGQALLASQDPNSAEAFSAAIAVWENNITKLSNPRHRAHALYYSAVSYQYLQNHQQAITHFQQLCDKYPENERAWYAQFQVARYCEKRCQENKLPPEQARLAYQKLLERYPGCSAAQTAAKKLNTL